MKKFPLCEVSWIDAMTYCLDLPNLEEVRKLKPIPARTAGYLMVKTRDYVTLCMTVFTETKASEASLKQFWIIPRGFIKSIRVIKD